MENQFMKTQENLLITPKSGEKREDLIVAQGLDPAAPYCLGNKNYLYERKCNSGHTDLTDAEIAFTGGYYDGYHWTVPVCLRCVNEQDDKRVAAYSHSTKFHLKEFKPENQ